MERDRNQAKDSQRPGVLQRGRLQEGKGATIKRAEKASARFNELKGIKLKFNKLWSTEYKEHNRSNAAIWYRGEPQYYDAIYVYREIYGLRSEMETLNKKGALRFDNNSSVKENDLWQTKFGGLSLLDIENMELDPQTHELAPEDIRRLNKMFRIQGILGVGKNKGKADILRELMYFALRQQIHPEMAVPKSLEKFEENITAYFDYYTSFIADFKRDSLDGDIMLFMLLMVFLRSPYLSITLASYLPAKLNISPSSVTKLYEQQELLASAFSQQGWRKIRDKLGKNIQESYREDAFPEDLARYQHYDQETDSAAASRMLNYIQGATTVQRQVENKDEAENLLEQLDKHRRDVVRNIMQNPEKRIEYQISKDYPADRVTMIKNRDTFVFILQFPDDIHLTLELDKTGRLFGIPPSLIRAYPHIDDVFIIDILEPLLKEYKAKDDLDLEKQYTVRQISTIGEPPIASDLEIPEEIAWEEDQKVKLPKRKKPLRMGTIFEADPLPPRTPPVPKLRRFVAYSKDDVEEMLGPKVGKQKVVVDQVLRAISNFENGHTNAIKIRWDSTGDIRVRAGDFRIVMSNLGNRNYSILRIARREDVYSRTK